MRKLKRNYELDMTHGSLIPKIASFALPLMITSILQLLYNAADVIVVGQFTGPQALAAVGSTGSLINLIINIFLGLSVGTNVVAARYYGSGNYKDTQATIHTSITISVIGGFVVGLIGFIFGGTFLSWMGTTEEVLPLATKYIRIYFLGAPVNMIYNFGAAVLRAVGDTRRPLYFLTFSGIVNVALNLFFVIALGMGVEGVAWATIIAQFISATLIIICLVRSDGYVHLNIKKLRIQAAQLKQIARVGLPAGFQAACFSISNVLIQSTVNSFGTTVMAGNAASANLEGFIYVSMNAFHQAAITFVSANVGAGENKRIRRVIASCIFLVSAIGILLGAIFYLLRYVLLNIYAPGETDVIAAGIVRLRIFAVTYFTCGIMDVLCGLLRGLGSAVVPMIVSILGACAFRIFWIYCILPISPTLNMLYISYPISWVLTASVYFICILVILKRYPVSKQGELST